MNDAGVFLQTDPIWLAIRAEAEVDARREPLLASFLHASILNHTTLEQALSLSLAHKLGSDTLPAISLREVVDEALLNDASIGAAIRNDLAAVRERDPACDSYLAPLLYFKGFHALEAWRVAHWLWEHDREALAMYLQSRISEVLAVDIHPGATVGTGILMDHATGIVIGETAVIGDNVSMLHGVTLGGTGKDTGDRHPTIGSGVLIGASATVLGPVHIGADAKIAAGSVVLSDVQTGCTVAGVPAVPVAGPCVEQDSPAFEMDHNITES